MNGVIGPTNLPNMYMKAENQEKEEDTIPTLVNKLVPCAWLSSFALKIWRLRLGVRNNVVNVVIREILIKC